jgi:hypothetical protein
VAHRQFHTGAAIEQSCDPDVLVVSVVVVDRQMTNPPDLEVVLTKSFPHTHTHTHTQTYVFSNLEIGITVFFPSFFTSGTNGRTKHLPKNNVKQQTKQQNNNHITLDASSSVQRPTFNSANMRPVGASFSLNHPLIF